MDGFESFWKLYPRRIGKLAAQREWKKLNPDVATVKEIVAALAWQVLQWDDPKYIPHPTTWLHQGRWLDEPPTAARTRIEQLVTENAEVMADLMGRAPLRRVK